LRAANSRAPAVLTATAGSSAALGAATTSAATTAAAAPGAAAGTEVRTATRSAEWQPRLAPDAVNKYGAESTGVHAKAASKAGGQDSAVGERCGSRNSEPSAPAPRPAP